jgi:signal transduction histidine kinase
LPQLEKLGLRDLVRSAVAAHEQRTNTVVELSLPESSPELSHPEKICVYRFVQEGLANAFRHAGGIGQRVAAEVHGKTVRVVVEDAGPGFDVAAAPAEGLGLAGLRERVESLGGAFEVTSGESGTRLAMSLRANEGDGR